MSSSRGCLAETGLVNGSGCECPVVYDRQRICGSSVTGDRTFKKHVRSDETQHPEIFTVLTNPPYYGVRLAATNRKKLLDKIGFSDMMGHDSATRNVLYRG